MREKQQIQVGLHRDKYVRLEEVKRELEAEIGHRLVWGDFLLILAGLRSRAQKDTVAHLAQDEPMTEEELEEAGVQSFPGLPITLSEEDRERIAELVADKVCQRLKPVYLKDRRSRKSKKEQR